MITKFKMVLNYGRCQKPTYKTTKLRLRIKHLCNWTFDFKRHSYSDLALETTSPYDSPVCSMESLDCICRISLSIPFSAVNSLPSSCLTSPLSHDTSKSIGPSQGRHIWPISSHHPPYAFILLHSCIKLEQCWLIISPLWHDGEGRRQTGVPIGCAHRQSA